MKKYGIMNSRLKIRYKQSEKITIPIDEHTNLVTIVDRWTEDDNKQKEEILTYIEKDGHIYQDISIARVSNKKKDKIELLVYGNCDEEDYTEKYEIGIWDEEE